MNFFDFKGGRVLKVVLLLTIIITLGIYSRFVLKQTKDWGFGPTTISVQGLGEVYAVPDVGQFSFFVTEKGANAEEAQTRSAEKVNNILAVLEELEVAEKDIKTENYNLYPIYRYETKNCPRDMYCPAEQVLDGFEVSQSISVKVRDLDKTGNILAKIGEKEVSNISNLNFVVDDIEQFKNEAREKAVENAKNKSESLEKALGVKFEKMVGFYEDDFSLYGNYRDEYTAKQQNSMVFAEDASGPSLPTGENVVRSQVSITYKVK